MKSPHRDTGHIAGLRNLCDLCFYVVKMSRATLDLREQSALFNTSRYVLRGIVFVRRIRYELVWALF